MLHGSTGPGLTSSELTRLLAGLSDTPVPATRPVFTERLGQWLDWTGAIALSAALNSEAVVTSGSASTLATVEADFHGVRIRLEAALVCSPVDRASSDASGEDFAPHRRHCLDRQQAMQDASSALRQRLRDALSQRSPALARLAAIDAVMDQTLGPRERALLGLVPLRLQAHFERLRRSHTGATWIDDFRHDMNRLLQAELAHRLLPAHGLLEALRHHDST